MSLLQTSRPASFDAYLRQYGPTLGRKAVGSLNPLHVPQRDGSPDFSPIEAFNENRVPFDPQAHVIAGASKMMEHTGNGFIVGEMGTGKTLMGMLAVHQHAKGKPYRVLVLCPDHLITTWEEEVSTTIPGAIIHRFENWKAMVNLIGSGYSKTTRDSTPEQKGQSDGPVPKGEGKLKRTRKRWTKPIGPEWYILGRNQAKFYPDKLGIGSPHAGYHLNAKGEGPAEVFANRSTAHRIVAHIPQTDENDEPILDIDGEQIMKTVIERRVLCPSCGMQVIGQKGIPMSVKAIGEKMPTCKGHFLDHIPKPREGRDGKFRLDDGRDRLPGSEEYRKQLGKTVKIRGHEYLVRPCEERLWQYTRKPYRYAPATIIQRKLRGLFKYLVIDEVHEQKSDESAQSMAAGKLMGVADHVLALTGTLIGGYAMHLFPLLLRMSPKTIVKEGFEWGDSLAWSQRFGRVDRIVTTKQTAGEVEHKKGQTSMRKARTGKSEERQVVRPGIMPTLYGRHMLGNSIFITLEELADELPDMNEYVGGSLMPKEPHREQKPDESAEEYEAFKSNEDMRYEEYRSGYIETAVDMDAETKDEYDRIEEELVRENKELLKRGSMKLLGAMLWTLMDYPDMPYGWRSEHPEKDAVGYYLLPGSKSSENYVGVVSPADLDQEKIRPKEQALIDICKKQKAEGRQSWVYLNMTGKRNLQPRLAKLLKDAGLKVGVLRSKDVDPIARKEWIDENGPKYDVILSNPTLVATGLTLFSKKEGGHNFSTLIFYETGYNLFTLRQAARRAWRIGQPFNCRVYYLYYKDSMQHRAMNLMSRKMAAAAALEGEFSAEGLVGMSGDDNAQMALARSLKESINDEDTQRGWTKLKSRSKAKKPQLAAAKSTLTDMIIGADETEEASDQMQLVGQTMLDRGVPEEEINASPVFTKPSKSRARCKLDEIMVKTSDSEREAIEKIKRQWFRPAEPERPKLAIEEPAEPYRLPALSREQLAAMFINMQENGLTVEDFV